MHPHDKITELIYTTQGLAHIMLYAIDHITTTQNAESPHTPHLFSQALILCEKLDELSKLLDSADL